MAAAHERDGIGEGESVDARRLIGEGRRAERKETRHGQRRHAGESGQRIGDAELRSGERFFRRGCDAQAAKTEARLIDNVGTKDVCVRDRVEVLND